jgi:hypothetical protein
MSEIPKQMKLKLKKEKACVPWKVAGLEIL